FLSRNPARALCYRCPSRTSRSPPVSGLLMSWKMSELAYGRERRNLLPLPSTWSLPTSPPAGHRRFGRNGGQSPKYEIRNPKSETNSNEQRSRSSKPSRRRRANWLGFENLSFEFRACFGFRISDLSSQRSGIQPKSCGTCSAPQRGEG